MRRQRGAYKKFVDDRDFSDVKVVPSYIPFARNLSALMEAQNITNYALAKKIGVKSPSSITNYRNAQQFPGNPEQLIKIAAALGTSIDALIGNTKETYTEANDLLYFADQLNISPIAISHIKSMSIGSSQSISGLDILLSDPSIIQLSAAIKAVADKVNIANKDISNAPTKNKRAKENVTDSWLNIINGKLYSATRIFEKFLEEMVKAKLTMDVRTEQEADNGSEE